MKKLYIFFLFFCFLASNFLFGHFRNGVWGQTNTYTCQWIETIPGAGICQQIDGCPSGWHPRTQCETILDPNECDGTYSCDSSGPTNTPAPKSCGDCDHGCNECMVTDTVCGISGSACDYGWAIPNNKDCLSYSGGYCPTFICCTQDLHLPTQTPAPTSPPEAGDCGATRLGTGCEVVINNCHSPYVATPNADCTNCMCLIPEADLSKILCTTPLGEKTGVNTALGCIPIGTGKEGENAGKVFGAWLIGRAIVIAGGIAFILIIFAGIQIMTAAGDPGKLQAGRELLSSAIAGLLLIILSIFLLRLIGGEIFQIPGFT